MALIKCPECEKEISDKSMHCVYCGCPIKSKTHNKSKVLLVVLIILLMTALILSSFFFWNPLDTNSPTNTTPNINNSTTSNSTTNNGSSQYNYDQHASTNSQSNNTSTNKEITSDKPSELEYANFLCDFYNKQLTSTCYLTYSIEKHVYQAHLDISLSDSYRYLSGNDSLASYRVYNEAYKNIYDAFIDMCIKIKNESEFDYGYKTTIEVWAPNDAEILFVTVDGVCTYSAYYNYVPKN